MTFSEYRKRLEEIERMIAEAKEAPPGDGEMIRGDIRQIFNTVSRLESETHYMEHDYE